MTQSSLSSCTPAIVPPASASPWAPGLRLMRPLDLRRKLGLLLLCVGLPLLLAVPLWGAWADAQPELRWMPLALLAAVGLAALYLGVCAWKSVVDDLARLHRAAHELAGAHAQLQLHGLQVRIATGEIARRTIALCGMLDADTHDAEQAGADLEAIQDEEQHTQQLMSNLRAGLLAWARRCQTLGELARGESDADTPADELAEAAGAGASHCHQLSERVSAAERLNDRRIGSMRRAVDRLQSRAERGMREAQQLMVLTRQIDAAQAATLLQLERMAACCAVPDAPAAAAQAQPAGERAPSEATASAEAAG